MKKKTVSGITLTLLLIGMLTLAFNIQQVKAEPTTIIVPDDYPTIQEAINAANEEDTIFVKNGTYNENICIWKSISLTGQSNDNTIIDGNGTGSNTAIFVSANNVNISDFTIRNIYYGIMLSYSNGCSVVGNNFENCNEGVEANHSNSSLISSNNANSNYVGIFVYYSFDTIVSSNNASENYFGIDVYASSNSTVCGNIANSNDRGILIRHSKSSLVTYNIVGNNTGYGIDIEWSENSTVYHNSLIDNNEQVLVFHSLNTTWDDDYPSGGNYWSDYTDVDLFSGPYQNISGSDGIWDHSYVINANNQDNYPLVEPWSPKPPSPVEATQELIETIETWKLPKGVENSLTSKLDNVIHLLDKGNEKGSTHKLIVLLNQVGALRGKKLTTEQANYLIAEAQRIIDLIKG